MNATTDAPMLLRLTAFTTSPDGGNPAGVWIGDALPKADQMQRIAAEVGYSETAFITPARGSHRTVRYYSPEAEVSFCGHATVAAGVALGQRDGAGTYVFETAAGTVPVDVRPDGDGYTGTLTSVEPRHEPVSEDALSGYLASLGWDASDLDGAIPPARAFAGAWHLVLAVDRKDLLDNLTYDFDSVKQKMLSDGLTTLQLIWRESDDVFHSRNPFPVGGVVEDPATGAAAAALGGYLRDARLVTSPTRLTIHQGTQMGRPSLLQVDIPSHGGIRVTGHAVPVTEEQS